MAVQVPVVEQAPVMEQPPVAVQPPVIKKKKGRTVGSVLLSILLTLVLLVFGIYTSVALSVRHMVSLESITAILTDMKIADTRVDYFVGGDEGTTLAEFIHSELSGQYAENITVRNLKKLIDSEVIKSFVAELLYGYVEDVFGKEGSGIISNDRLEEFFEDYSDEINDVLDYNIKSSAYDNVVTYIDEEFGLEDEYNFVHIREGNEEVLGYIALAGSYPVLYICAGLCILYVLLLLIVNRGRAGSWVTAGISSLLIGGVHLAG